MFASVNASYPHTAILFFSNRPMHEGRRKRYWRGRNDRRNTALAQQLSSHTQGVLAKTGLPVFHFHEGNQQGASFGERLSNAYEALFAKGFDTVIAVGNDSPEIGQVDWNQVLEQLTQGRLVIGPSKRGGAYLIGLHKSTFCRLRFQELPWQQPELFAVLQAYGEHMGSIYQLPVLRDINWLGDIFALAQEVQLHSSGLTWLYLFVSGAVKKLFTPPRPLISTLASTPHQGRAPPC
ncbi:MAG: DUF2064 domain-containing protein [Bacteroidetes bacterium]|nr:MAG: DUF2064 domain-containing protein [Bacteroidota bacterium]